MTNEEAINFGEMWLDMNEDAKDSQTYAFFERALEVLKAEPIMKIPKDYKYDTETKDFLVYRHKYTGDEIHIERPIPRYRLEQEPCEDAVSLDSVIDTIEWYRTNPQHFTKDNLIEDIKGLPPVAPKQRWVPVSERYPKDYENVLITYGKGVFMGCTKENHSRWYMMHYYGSFETDGSEVTAWMPLPKPYKKGE